MDNYEVTQGVALAIQASLIDDQGNPITSYAGTETLTATLWPGGNLPAVLTPTPTWISGPLGTIRVITSASQTAGLAEGRYQGSLDVLDPSYGPLLAYEWTVDVVPAPGSGAVAPAYCSMPDLLVYASTWLRTLQTPDTQSGYSQQCGRARSWLDDLIIAGWQVAMPIGLGDPGYGAVLVGQNPGQLPSAWLRQQLDAGGLVRRDLVVEICAKKSLAFVCEGQVGPTDKGTEFRKLGRWFHGEANGLVKTLRAEIDADLDGFPEFAVNLGQKTMRWG